MRDCGAADLEENWSGVGANEEEVMTEGRMRGPFGSQHYDEYHDRSVFRARQQA